MIRELCLTLYYLEWPLGGVVALVVKECDMSLQGAHLVCGTTAGDGVKRQGVIYEQVIVYSSILSIQINYCTFACTVHCTCSL